LYLPSKFIKSRYKIPLLIIIFFFVYLLFHNSLRIIFISFSKNLALSENKYLKERDRLKTRNLQLSLELKELSSLEEENKKLKKMIKFKKDKKIDLVPLRIVAVEPSQYRRVILVDGGKNCGLKENMFVLDENGYLVGKTLRVYKDYSEVALINDPDFATTVRIGDCLGMLKGTLHGAIKIFYIERKEIVKGGDIVWATSYSSDLNIFVGKVKSVKEDKNNLFLDITAESFSKPYSFKSVFIVK